jgi:hypothetical protein
MRPRSLTGFLPVLEKIFSLSMFFLSFAHLGHTTNLQANTKTTISKKENNLPIALRRMLRLPLRLIHCLRRATCLDVHRSRLACLDP